MPPKTTKTMLSADETRAMQARKAAAKAEQAKKDAEKKQKAAEKAEFEKQKAAKKAEKEAAKKMQAEAAGGKPPAGGAGAGRSKEQELSKLVKKGEKHEEGSNADYELALDCYREAMDGFRSMNADRPKLLEKITRIEKLIEDEATC
jgi:hypothetical protein